jgi:putative transposase
MQKFQNKYRIPSARAPWWDYGNAAAYFITICTKKMQHYFGYITDHKMNLSNCGVLADVFWHEIPHHAKNIELGAFTVMPNHIHGILILNENPIISDANLISAAPVQPRHALALQSDFPDDPIQQGHAAVQPGHALALQSDFPDAPIQPGHAHVQPRHALALHSDFPDAPIQPGHAHVQPRHALALPPSPAHQRFQNQGKNTVSSIIGSYKSAVTKHANRLNLDNGWQGRFHDHIIRNDQEYQRINDYIESNVANWKKDKFSK